MLQFPNNPEHLILISPTLLQRADVNMLHSSSHSTRLRSVMLAGVQTRISVKISAALRWCEHVASGSDKNSHSRAYSILYGARQDIRTSESCHGNNHLTIAG